MLQDLASGLVIGLAYALIALGLSVIFGVLRIVNLGMDHLAGDEGWTVLVDGSAEVTAGWWRPFVDALEADPRAGIAWQAGPGERVRHLCSGRVSAAACHRRNSFRGTCGYVKHVEPGRRMSNA